MLLFVLLYGLFQIILAKSVQPVVFRLLMAQCGHKRGLIQVINMLVYNGGVVVILLCGPGVQIL